MFPAESLIAFVFVSLMLAVVPGPAVLYIATRSATQGRSAGFASVAGITTGGMVHVIAATAGLTVLLAKSAVAMQYIRFAGALYLVYLGIQRLRDAAASESDEPKPLMARESLRKIYRDGVIVNILNPKTSLFYLSFLPQFVDPSRGSAPLQVFILGCTFLAIALISDSAYALAASAVASKTRSVFTRKAGAYASAAIYIGLGAAAAFTGKKSH